MPKKGFFTEIVVLAVVAAIFYFIVVPRYSVIPNERTIAVAKEFLTYPQAYGWEIENNDKFCPFNFLECKTPPSVINFSAKVPWSAVYGYYRQNINHEIWHTNSTIITSTPTFLSFDNKNGCIAKIEEKDYSIFDYNEKHSGKFTISIICK